ncbi:MAG: hypothetical protein K2M05_05330, partial [Paramuribaculum sp.]|nr:hypothetical protein [Paramuribaculum sp.]
VGRVGDMAKYFDGKMPELNIILNFWVKNLRPGGFLFLNRGGHSQGYFKPFPVAEINPLFRV